MAAKKSGLGRGLNALIAQGGGTGPTAAKSRAPAPKPAAREPVVSPDAQGAESGGPVEAPIHMIVANPWQPRGHFDEESLEELAASIREMGVLSPLLVRKRPEGGGYQLVAGERRFRAAQRAELKKVPVIVRELTDREALEIALVENLQRRDLNVIEEAEGYQRLAEEFGLTQETIAKRVGKGRATVANALRLLALSTPVRDMVEDGRLSPGHAKVLLSLEIAPEQEAVAEECVRARWSVRELERRVKIRLRPTGKRTSPGGKPDIPTDHLQHLTDQLHQRLGTGVRIVPTRTLPNGKKQRGKVEIDIYSNDDLDRVLEILGLSETF